VDWPTFSSLSANLTGPGNVQIDAGRQLTLGGNAILDLSGDQGQRGTVTVDGLLLVTEQAQVRNTTIKVHQAEITTDQPVQFNDIHLLDTLNSGGKFFVQDNARILNNTITSEGDRYLDLDPDPALPNHPQVDGNQIRVRIITQSAYERGTLLELRARDYECEPGGVNPNCLSGAHHAPVSGRFDNDPAQNWVLDTLEIGETAVDERSGEVVERGAKVTLTNRPGLQYRFDTSHPETVYVKNLVLHAGSVLNTGLQTLYYENLLDENGNALDPNDLPGGRQIIDVPLLGFSLGNIGMDDTTPSPFNEFDVRVRERVTPSAELQPCQCDGSCPNNNPPQDTAACGEGQIRLVRAYEVVQQFPALAQMGGLMEMATQAPGKEPGISVAAKGSFARAGDEDITVVFDYLFIENPGAEIAVYLSDDSSVGVRSFEVARVRMPAAGRPGSMGSNQFATFYGTFPRAVPGVYQLNFTRGTHVEVALIAPRDGQNHPVPARVLIDNLDPQVICRFECASFDGIPGVTEADFLLLLAEYGRTLGSNDPKSCLDSKISRDQYVEGSDLLAWDTFFDGALNACGTGATPLSAQTSSAAQKAAASPTGIPGNRFLVAGKPQGAGQQTDSIYAMKTDGVIAGSPLAPAGGTGSRGNGRLVRDGAGAVYQIHGVNGLIRLSDGQAVIPPGTRSSGAGTVYIGLTPTGDGDFAGVPMADAEFDPHDATIVYVAPVLIAVPAQGSTPAHSYRAAAKLQWSTGGTPVPQGQYNLLAIYGTDPWFDPNVTTSPPEASPYSIQWIREIEISRDGQWLYVTCAHALNNNEWLLAYSTSGGAGYRIALDGLSSGLKDPVALLASASQDKLYLASAADPAANSAVYRLSANGPNVSLDGMVQIADIRQITSITERPGDSAVYALGFQAPAFDENQTFSDGDPIFTSPRWASIPASTSWSTGALITASAIGGSDLALTLSAIFAPTAADLNHDGHVDTEDIGLFRNCATRANVLYSPGALPSGCTLSPDGQGKIPADFDKDGDVDMFDFGRLQRCYGGVGQPPADQCEG
jgi:hypothetical protein